MNDLSLIFLQLYEIAILSIREAFRKKFVLSVILMSVLFLVIDFNCERNFANSTNDAVTGYSIDLAITFFVMSFLNMLISIVIPSGLIADEMENKTYTMILARPIHRMTYIMGKILGVFTLVAGNLVFVLLFYSAINAAKNNIPPSVLWKSTGFMLINYFMLISLVSFLTLFINRTAGILGSLGLVFFTAVSNLSFLIAGPMKVEPNIWRDIAYWSLPQFGTIFLYSISFIASIDWDSKYGIYTLYHSSVWIILLLAIIYITFNRKELN